MVGSAARIVGLGRYLPSRVVHTDEVARRLGVDAAALASATGVHERRYADRSGHETASAMGASAAREALEKADIRPESLDLVVNASGTVEQSIPDGGALIQRALGLGKSGIASLTVHATCLSFVAALDLVSSAIAAGRYRRVLVVSSDIASAGIDWSDPESAGLFGDGAAAAVLVRAEPLGAEGHTRDVATGSRFLAARFSTFGDDASLASIEGGGTRAHPNDAALRPSQNLFHMEGPRLLRRVLGRGRPFLEALSRELPDGVRLADALVIPHQASEAGLAMLPAFGLDASRVVRTLERLGNCVAASIPLTLYEAVESGRLRRGDLALLCGTGAGLSLGAIVLRF
ncbi:MAG: 3-oxoacyl-[acyl-carrier-protein] synthase III C-terminal domain-containing protein [Sandaracinus sp.]